MILEEQDIKQKNSKDKANLYDELTKLELSTNKEIINRMIETSNDENSLTDKLLKLTSKTTISNEDFNINDILDEILEELNINDITSPFEVFEKLQNTPDGTKDYAEDLKKFYIDGLIRAALIIKEINNINLQIDSIILNPERKGGSKIVKNIDGTIDTDNEIQKRKLALQKYISDGKGEKIIIKRRDSLKEIESIKPLTDKILVLNQVIEAYSNNKNYIINKKIEEININLIDSNNNINETMHLLKEQKEPKKDITNTNLSPIRVVAEDPIEDQDFNKNDNTLDLDNNINIGNNDMKSDEDQDKLSQEPDSTTIIDQELPDGVKEYLLSLADIKDTCFYSKLLILFAYSSEYKKSRNIKLIKELDIESNKVGLNVGGIDIKDIIAKLEDISSKEGYLQIQHKISKLNDLAEKFQSNDTLKSIIEFKNICSQILLIVEPINFSAIKFYLTIADEEVEKIRDKKVIYLLGNTGAGKTTLLLYMNGIKFEVKGKGLVPNYNNRRDLMKFETKEACQSVTRFVKMPEKPTHSDWCSCDTAGFGDTSTINVEIANNVSLIKAMQMAKEAIVVYVLTNQYGERFEKFNEVPELLSRLIKSKNKEDSVQKIQFVVNKISSDEDEKHFRKAIQDIDIDKRQFIDEEAKHVCELILDQIDTYINVKKENPSYESLIQNLTRKKNIIKSPGNFFKVTVSNKALVAMNDFFKTKKAAITSLLENKMFDMAAYNINVLKQFSEEFKDFDQEYTMTLDNIKDIFEKRQIKFLKLVDKVFNIENSISIEDLEEIYEYANDTNNPSYFEIEKLVDFKKNENERNLKKIRTHINGAVECMIKKLSNFKFLECKIKDIETINKYISKLGFISEYDNKKEVNFNLKDEIYKEFNIFINSTKTQLEKVLNELRRLQFDSEIDQVKVLLEHSNIFIINMQELDFSPISKKIKEEKFDISLLKEVVLEFFQNKIQHVYKSEISKLIEFENIKLENLFKIDFCFYSLLDFTKTFCFKEDLDIIKSNIVSLIETNFNVLKEELQNYKNSSTSTNENKTKTIDKDDAQKIFNVITKLSQLLIMEKSEVKNEIRKIRESLLNMVSRFKIDNENAIKKQDFDEWDVEDIYNKYSFLSSFNWLDDTTSTAENFEKLICKKMDEKRDKLLYFDFKNFEISTFNSSFFITLLHIHRIKECFIGSESIKKCSQEIINDVEKSFDIHFVEYIRNLDVEKSLKLLEKYYTYICFFQKQKYLNQKVNAEFDNNFKEKISERISFYSNQLLKIIADINGLIEKIDTEEYQKIYPNYANFENIWRNKEKLNISLTSINVAHDHQDNDLDNSIISKCKVIFKNTKDKFEELKSTANKNGLNILKKNLECLLDFDYVFRKFEGQGKGKFSSLLDQTESEIVTVDKEIGEKVKSYLENGNFDEVTNLLENADKTNQVKIRNSVSKEYNDISKDIKTELQNFYEHLNKITGSKKIEQNYEFSDLADKVNKREQIKKFFKFINKDSFVDIERFINNFLDQMAENGNLSLVNTFRSYLKNLKRLLDSFDDIDGESKLKLTKLMQKIKDQESTLNTSYKDEFNKKINFNKPLDLLQDRDTLIKMKQTYNENSNDNGLKEYIISCESKVIAKLELFDKMNIELINKDFKNAYSEIQHHLNQKDVVSELFPGTYKKLINISSKFEAVMNNFNSKIDSVTESTDENELKQIEEQSGYYKEISQKFNNKINEIIESVLRYNIDFSKCTEIKFEFSKFIDSLKKLEKFCIYIKEGDKIINQFVINSNIKAKITISTNLLQELDKVNFSSSILDYFNNSTIKNSYEQTILNYSQQTVNVFLDYYSKNYTDLKSSMSSSNYNNFYKNYTELKCLTKVMSANYEVISKSTIVSEASKQKINNFEKDFPETVDKFINEMVKSKLNEYSSVIQIAENNKLKKFTKESEFNDFYNKITSSISFIDSFKEFISDNNPQEMRDVLVNKVVKTHKEFIFSDESINIFDEPELANSKLTCLKKYNDLIIEKLTGLSLETELKSFRKTIEENIKTLEKSIERVNTTERTDKKLVCEEIVKLNKFCIRCPDYQEKSVKFVKNYLKQFKKKELEIFRVILEDSGEEGSQVLNNFSEFQYKASKMRELTQKQGIDYVIREMKSQGVNKHDRSVILKLYERYITKFEEIKKGLRLKSITKHSLIDLILSKKDNIDISNLKKEKGFFDFLTSVVGLFDNKYNIIPELIAMIACLWSYNKCPDYYDENSDSEYGVAPHPAQIVGILRVLGCDHGKLQNNLVEVLTGEGKSILLGITSAVLSIFGCDAYVACYSKNLSERDQDEMNTMLFNDLGISQNIVYGTFQQLCEAILNSSGDIRENTLTVFKNNGNIVNSNSSNDPPKKARPQVLLIDEVDVLFTKEFFGETYNPSANLRDITITNLLKKIWSSREFLKTKTDIEKLILGSEEYKACLTGVFASRETLLKSHVFRLVNDLKTFDLGPEYKIVDNKILYKQQDIYSDKISYGYKTMFSYLKECDNGKINSSVLESQLKFLIDLGSFSYLDTLSRFVFVMGVSGTINSLYDQQLEIVKEYLKINQFTYLPSIYGSSRRKEKSIFVGEDENIYYSNIFTCLKESNIATKPVLIFFDDCERLDKFKLMLDSENFTYSYVTELDTKQDIEKKVKLAAYPSAITLFTRTFGRGTDFELSQNVAENGGCLCIQTFLHEDISEQIQVRGRVGRQGRDGLYSLILLKADLETIGFKEDDYLNYKNNDVRMREIIDKCVENSFLKRFEILKIKNKNCSKEHAESMDFLSALNNENNLSSVNNFLDKFNFFELSNDSCNMYIAIDATGSMSNLFSQTKSVVQEVYKRTNQILKDKACSKGFSIKVGLYRNYSSGIQKIYEASNWESDFKGLEKFMSSTSVSGGQGNEAIEIVLHEINKEHKDKGICIKNALLIGDASPNTKNDITAKKGNNFGNTTYKDLLYYEDEINKLKINGITLDCYYLEPQAKVKFDEMATLTGGKSQFLNVNDSNSIDDLTEIFSTTVLKELGGDSFVSAYKAMFATKKYNS